MECKISVIHVYKSIFTKHLYTHTHANSKGGKNYIFWNFIWKFHIKFKERGQNERETWEQICSSFWILDTSVPKRDSLFLIQIFFCGGWGVGGGWGGEGDLLNWTLIKITLMADWGPGYRCKNVFKEKRHYSQGISKAKLIRGTTSSSAYWSIISIKNERNNRKGVLGPWYTYGTARH